MTIGTNEVLRQPAVGHTLLSITAPFAAAPALVPDAKFKIETDLAPLIQVGTAYNVLVVNQSVPVNSVAESHRIPQKGPRQAHVLLRWLRHLLGTGTPVPSPDRFGPCTLVEAGDQKFLIDASRGATIRLYQLKLPIGRIDVQFLTHYHSDQTSGVPDVWLTGWLESYFGTRKTPYRVIGLTGARQLIENLERAYALDIKIRVADQKLPLSGIATEVTEFDCDGTVYERHGVRVIAFEVDHGDVIKPCHGYRFEYGGRVAVFSSDTCYNHNVLKYGAGADLLLHEVASAPPELMKQAYIQKIIGHHTTPREAGLVFAQTKPKLATYTHIAPARHRAYSSTDD
jgi:ribonuclease Z